MNSALLPKLQASITRRGLKRNAADALPVVALSVLATAYARTLAPSITWAHNGADSGDLAVAAVTLGVAHPSGYPTYVLLAQPFLRIPLGEAAFRLNLLSATAGLLACLVIYALVRRLGARAWGARAAALAALALGTAPLFWSQAVIAEVYTLNALFAALLLWCMAAPPATWRGWLAHGLVAGLALGNHVTIGLFVMAWLLSSCLRLSLRRSMTIRQLAAAIAGLAVGLSVYLYVPLRAAAHPAVNWGSADTWGGFWWLVTGALYRPLAFGLPLAQAGERLREGGALLLRQFSGPGLALAVVGLCYGAPRMRRWLWVSAALVAAQAVFALGYNTPDYAVHLIPVLVILAIWIGLGAATVLQSLYTRRALGTPFAAVAIGVALLWPLPATFAQVNASGDTQARTYAVNELAAAPPNAVVLTAEDRDSFALLYVRVALGQRPDTAVLIEPLLQFGWYRANMRAVYTGLRIPETPADDWRELLAAANPTRAIVRATPLTP